MNINGKMYLVYLKTRANRVFIHSHVSIIISDTNKTQKKKEFTAYYNKIKQIKTNNSIK